MERWLALVAAVLAAGCGRSAVELPPPFVPVDAGMDAARPDAGRDAGRDAGLPDVGRDVALPFDGGFEWAELCPEESAAAFVLFPGLSPIPGQAPVRFENVHPPIRIDFADVYFLFDATSSMRDEIEALSRAVVSIVSELECEDSGIPCMAEPDCGPGLSCGRGGTCISDPDLHLCVESLWSGVGTYGGARDTYVNRLSLQPDPTATSSALVWSLVDGSLEALFESVACAADPTVCAATGCTAGGGGCPSFRPDARRILFGITDEPNQCRDCSISTAPEVGSRLVDEEILFVGIDADMRGAARMHLTAIATAAGSFDSDGDPLVLSGSGGDVSTAVVAALDEIVGRAPVRATLVMEDDPGDPFGIDATRLVDHVEVDAVACPAGGPVADDDGDGFADTFVDLPSSSDACYQVFPVVNDILTPAEPVVLMANATLRVDDLPSQSLPVCFVIPPPP
jgi:hypothetical protein